MSSEDEKPVTPIAYDTAGIAAAMKARQAEETGNRQIEEFKETWNSAWDTVPHTDNQIEHGSVNRRLTAMVSEVLAKRLDAMRTKVAEDLIAEWRVKPSQVFPGAPGGLSAPPKPPESVLEECPVDEQVEALHIAQGSDKQTDAYQLSMHLLEVRSIVMMLHARGYVIARKLESDGLQWLKQSLKPRPDDQA